MCEVVLHVRAIIAVLGIKRVIPEAISRAVLLQQENRLFPRTLSSQNDSISYKRRRMAVCMGGGKRVAHEREKEGCYKQCSQNELSSSHSSFFPIYIYWERDDIYIYKLIYTHILSIDTDDAFRRFDAW